MVYELHPQAKDGFSAGHSEGYDRARSNYPSEAFSYLRGFFAGGDTLLNIVEIGSGTGIFTRGILSHPEWSSSISSLEAVEPSEGMRDVFSKTVRDPRVNVSEGTFDRTGISDGWADLIVIATAFHWCLDFDAAIKEFCRILKSDGLLCLTWNSLAGKRVGWVTKLWDLPAKYDELRHHQTEQWRALYDASLYNKSFQPSVEKVFQHDVVSTPQGVIDRVLSWSAIAPLDQGEKEKVKDEVLEILAEGNGLEWADKDKGLVKFPHDNLVVVMRRKEGSS